MKKVVKRKFYGPTKPSYIREAIAIHFCMKCLNPNKTIVVLAQNQLGNTLYGLLSTVKLDCKTIVPVFYSLSGRREAPLALGRFYTRCFVST